MVAGSRKELDTRIMGCSDQRVRDLKIEAVTFRAGVQPELPPYGHEAVLADALQSRPILSPLAELGKDRCRPQIFEQRCDAGMSRDRVAVRCRAGAVWGDRYHGTSGTLDALSY